MEENIETIIERYEKILQEMKLTLEAIEMSKQSCEQIAKINEFISQFGCFSDFISFIKNAHDNLLRMKNMLTVEEAAQYLGMKVSTLYKKTMDNEIPFYTPCSKRLYFKRSELDQWMLQDRHATNEEMLADASLSGKTNLYAPKRSKHPKTTKTK